MGCQLSVLSLGPPEILLANRPVSGLGRGKMTALLVYLITQPGHHSRETLAELFWPDLTLQAARFNLRHTFFHLREALGKDGQIPFLLAGREWLSFNSRSNHWCDVAEFRLGPELFDREPEKLAQLTDLYRGEFLAGFSLPDCQEFEQWLQLKREEMRRQTATLLEHLAHHHEKSRNFDKALLFAQRLSALDPLNEASQYRLMHAYTLCNRPATALAQYDTYRTLLQDELGVLPNREIEALYQQIVSGEPQRQRGPVVADDLGPPAAPTERRQVTVLYCELSLGNIDDADEAAELLRNPQQACIDLLVEFGGHVTQSHGGALLAYFGYPCAKEDAVLAAIAAAKAIADVAAPARARCGVHTGTIVTSPSLRSPDVAGRASMVAMRVALAADHSCIALSEETFRLVDGKVRCRRLFNRRSGGASHPRGIYLLEEADPAARSRRSSATGTHFIGRATELRQLDLLWQQACSGRSTVVLLRGEPGIGKSRLVSEFVRNIVALGKGTVKEYVCLPQHQGSSFHPFGDLAVQVDSLPGHPSSAGRQGHLIHGIAAAILDTGVSKPLLVSVEDIHWAAPSSLDIIKLLVAQERNSRALVVLTARSDFDLPPWTETMTVINLAQLTAAYSRRLADLLAPGLAEEQAQHIVVRADGVPLFIEELTRWMQAADHSCSTGPIPATLQDLLMARIDRLGSARRLAQVAATVGKSVSPKLLAALATPDDVDMEKGIPLLLESGLVLRSKGLLQFNHTLIQETAYLSQTLGVRRLTHRRVAEVLQREFKDICRISPETLAHHFTEGGELDAAIHYWKLAGGVAAGRSGHPEAVAHYRRALDLLARTPRSKHNDKIEFSVTTALGMQLVLARGLGNPEAQECFAQAYAMCHDVDDAEQLFPVVHGQWIGAGCYSTYRHAEELTERLARLAELSNRPDFMLAAEMAKVVTLFWVGRPTDVAIHADAVRKLLPQTELNGCIKSLGVDPLVYSLVFSGLSRHFMGHFDEATRLADEALSVAEASGYGDSRCVALTMAALLQQHRGRPKQVMRYCDAIDDLAETHGIPLWAAASKCLRGWAMAVQGQSSGAALCRLGLEEVRRKMASSEAMFGNVYLQSLAVLGHHQQVLSDVDAIIEAARERHDRHAEPELYRLKGEALLAVSLDNRPAAKACFQQALDLAERANARMLELRAAISLFRSAPNDIARTRLQQVLIWFAKEPETPDVMEARQLLGARAKAHRPPSTRANPRLRWMAA